MEVIYTALAWRNKAFGQALDFVWGAKDNSNDFAIRQSSVSVKIYKNFKERADGVDVGFSADGLSGGVLLGVKGQGGISFFDWESAALVRRIEVDPQNVSDFLRPCSSTDEIVKVYWSESGELVTLACEDTFYVLRFYREAYTEALNAGQVEDDGVEAAFDVITDVSESVKSGQWVGDSFFYTNSANRLCYLVGAQSYTISHFDQPMYMLGYLPRDSRIYVANKDVSVQSFALSLSVVEYQTLVLRGEMEAASELLVDIPDDQKNKIARFLEGQGLKELALEVATDPEHRFDLALALGNLPIALEIARSANVEHRWKTVGDAALSGWDLALAEECFVNAKDLGSLLLLYTSTSNTTGLRKLEGLAQEANLHNVAFTCLWQMGDIDGCIDLLVQTNRIAEAVLFSQTYKPSRTPGTVSKWREGLDKEGKSKVSKIIGVPGEDDDLFPEWDEYIRLEQDGGSKAANLVDIDGANEHEAATAEANGVNGADDELIETGD